MVLTIKKSLDVLALSEFPNAASIVEQRYFFDNIFTIQGRSLVVGAATARVPVLLLF